MSGRDPRERGRASTPLEPLYDLTYVIAFAAAAEQLAHHVADGHIGPSIGAYLFAIFSVSWAWMNFTWFASAYGNDDALFRVAAIVQMVGVVILIFGLPPSFSATSERDRGRPEGRLTRGAGGGSCRRRTARSCRLRGASPLPSPISA
ncbi:low temperature requirement protein A [Sphaerisporangium sp. NPDC005289]|uniref:low temperature requirement protein A n=1 Tax=Sphaerisporangium sp. NPDC005289 TaxID=3155247 RepID=UPI0033B3F16F